MKGAFKFIAILSLIFINCKKNVSAINNTTIIGFEQGPPLLEEQTHLNVSYGTHPSQLMDIYLPKGRNVIATPLIILIHGGEWKSGDKSNMQGYVSKIQDSLKQYAIANINYRLFQNGNNLFPTQENDVNAAIIFLSNLRDSLKISGKKVLFGESAGAQLALLNGYKLNKPIINAVIGFGTPANLEEWYLNPPNTSIRTLLQDIIGGSLQQLPSAYTSGSVTNFVSTNSPHTLLIHGKNDNVVPLTLVQNLKQILINNAIDVNLIVADNESHNFSPTGMILLNTEILKFLSSSEIFR